MDWAKLGEWRAALYGRATGDTFQSLRLAFTFGSQDHGIVTGYELDRFYSRNVHWDPAAREDDKDKKSWRPFCDDVCSYSDYLFMLVSASNNYQRDGICLLLYFSYLR